MLRLFSCLKTKEEYMELTPRLAAVAALVPACHCMADIGTDHAYVPMNLVKKHRAAHAVASDIHKGPLEIARKHIGENGLSRWIETRLGGGLETLQPGECEGVVIAGMGGLMICDILANSPETAGALSFRIRCAAVVFGPVFGFVHRIIFCFFIRLSSRICPFF